MKVIPEYEIESPHQRKLRIVRNFFYKDTFGSKDAMEIWSDRQNNISYDNNNNNVLYDGGDIASGLSKMFPNKEFHIPGYNFCGPGTNLKRRLGNNDVPITPPVNSIDAQCMKHDIEYRNNKDIANRHLADTRLIHNLNKLEGLSFTEKMSRSAIKTAMKGKIAFGMGVDNNNNNIIDEEHYM